MAVNTSFKKGPIKTLTTLFVTILLVNGANAQKRSDSTKKPLLASLDKPSEAGFTRATNVVFPEILRGNEKETLSYIENFSTKRRVYIERMYTKGRKLLPKAATILKKYDLPTELSLLLALESAYNGSAVSKAGAVGYWQIMDVVAKEYGMKYVACMSAAEKKKLVKATLRKDSKKGRKIAKLVDDRKNFTLATHTAARYLSDRRRNLNDNWLLIVASYNCGVGNVWNAMKKSRKADPGFWDIKKYLPAETQAYVMNFVAMNVIFHNYDLFATNQLRFTPEKIIFTENFEKVMTEQAEASGNER